MMMTNKQAFLFARDNGLSFETRRAISATRRSGKSNMKFFEKIFQIEKDIEEAEKEIKAQFKNRS